MQVLVKSSILMAAGPPALFKSLIIVNIVYLICFITRDKSKILYTGSNRWVYSGDYSVTVSNIIKL